MSHVDKFAVKYQSIILLVLIGFFLILTLPGTYPASRTYSELWAFDMDEPHFMIPPLRQLLNGKYPTFWNYGNFPAFASAFIFLPFIAIYKMIAGQLEYFHIVMILRFTQIFMAVLSIIFVFKISKLFCKTTTSLFSVLLLLSSNQFYLWTLNLHPDIFQLAMITGSVYFLLLFSQNRRLLFFFLSAIFCGLATSSKYWGVWLIPSAIFSIFFFSATKHSFSKQLLYTILLSFFYIAIAIGVFLALNYHFVTNKAVWEVFKSYSQISPHLKLSLINELQSKKISNFTSPDFFGTSFVLIYLTSLLIDTLQFFRRKTKSLIIIHIAIVTLAIYYFTLFNDPVNIPRGERYLLSFIALMIVPMAHLLEKFGAVAYSLFVFSQIARILAIPPQKINLLQTDFFYAKNQQTIKDALNIFYQKESYGTFMIRQWAKNNVPKDAKIYVEAYMNIGNQWPGVAPDTENDDLPTKNIFYSPGIKEENIPIYNPDYIFVKDIRWANALATGFPQYKVITEIGDHPNNKVYVLGKQLHSSRVPNF